MLNSSAGEEAYSKCTSPGCLRCRSNSHARGLMLQKLVKHFHDNNLPIGAVQRVIKALQVEEEDLEGVRHPLQQPTVLYLQDLDTKPVWTDSIMLEQDVPEGCAITVGGRRLTWTDGRCLLFDDSFFHEVHHHGNQKDPPRVVFMVDLWHPQVTSLERKALNFLYPPQ
ncbi:ASPHD2 [Branchiostoma lanceolatum]|uniref:ASPHD2 protein n=1 Tax=Branchiostoma lanceolatum TaxID=7740 RepID=A0A8K0ACV3_BRALA|nr:ASPHD2 [Branchiostoma lanceolatum]